MTNIARKYFSSFSEEQSFVFRNGVFYEISKPLLSSIHFEPALRTKKKYYVQWSVQYLCVPDYEVDFVVGARIRQDNGNSVWDEADILNGLHQCAPEYKKMEAVRNAADGKSVIEELLADAPQNLRLLEKIFYLLVFNEEFAEASAKLKKFGEGFVPPVVPGWRKRVWDQLTEANESFALCTGREDIRNQTHEFVKQARRKIGANDWNS